MQNEILINTADIGTYAEKLSAGQRVYLSGNVYTARDAAHKRLVRMIEDGETLPFDLFGSTIYYAGPTPAPEGMVIGSCGPTTSGRMDIFTPKLLDKGLKAMIGKGKRNQDVVDSMVKNKAVYFCAVGGAGALASKCIISAKVIAFEELGCESIKELVFDEFPLTVAVDSTGKSIIK